MKNEFLIFIKDAFGWGIGLWLISYILGIIVFIVVPANMIGWVISPIGIAITLWVLLKKVKGEYLDYYFKIAVAWTLIAIFLDNVFLVQLFRPADGYYKLDVYFYYATTFILPLIAGVFESSNQKNLLEKKSENIEKVLKMFQSKDKITNNDVEYGLKVSDPTATRYLDELQEQGKIKQVGKTGRSVYYERK